MGLLFQGLPTLIIRGLLPSTALPSLRVTHLWQRLEVSLSDLCHALHVQPEHVDPGLGEGVGRGDQRQQLELLGLVVQDLLLSRTGRGVSKSIQEYPKSNQEYPKVSKSIQYNIQRR